MIKRLLQDYYSTLSLDDILKLAWIFKEDFLLFGYNPSYIYKYLSPSLYSKKHE